VTVRYSHPYGQWADLRERPTNAQYVAITEAAERAQRGTGSWTRWAQTLGRELTVAWHARGDDGKPLDLDDDGWDLADPEFIDGICTKAQELYREWRASRRPKATSVTSSDATSAETAST
jgi:hypothetical protein